MIKQRLPFRVYRPVIIARGIMAQPGAIVECTKIEAMAVNTIQPMTLREVANDMGKTETGSNIQEL